MSPFSLQIFVTLFVFNLFTPYVTQSLESQALLEFKKQLTDPLHYLDSWKASDPPCHFFGVSCENNTGKVTGITLENKSLSGHLSPSISVLRSLHVLVLADNSIMGVLPAELANCSKLKVLNVTKNKMTGSLPDLSNLTNLEALHVSVNQFSGRFPTWVGNLTNLVSLGLGGNNYDQGEIPEEIGNLKNLTWLYLSGSNLRGEIPESIFNLHALETLDICMNMITGSFPKALSKLRNIKKIELYDNKFTGRIPPQLATLKLLEEFDISSNQMYGTLPPQIGNMKNLIVFQLHQNNFSGELPRGFGNLHNLLNLSIYGNSFSGEFPKNIGRFSPLNAVDISENKFAGHFPKYMCANGNLQFLLAGENNFSGELSDNYARCKSLIRLRIYQNQLSGKIPDGLWALPSATIIDFSDNDFSGGISPDIGSAVTLGELKLMNNRFSGYLPNELGQLTHLQKLDLSNNDFCGIIPSSIGALKQLSYLNLKNNSFTGAIPADLSKCSGLVDLNLASNSLSYNIPESFSQISSLNSLNLSGNKFIGSIPEDLHKLKLSSIDLSNNQLSGKIHSDLLMMGGDQAFIGNKKLCINQIVKGQMNLRLNVCENEYWHNHKYMTVIFSIALLVLVCMVSGLLVLCCRNYILKENYTTEDCEKKAGDSEWEMEIFHPVQFDAEDICNLDEHNLIGTGSTGKVYRVDTEKAEGMVAVKQLWEGKANKVFTAEIGILGNIRHRNILKLYACLTNGVSNLLVFEYMVVEDSLKDSDSNCIAGTHGYIAPELAYTPKMTEKCDIYSFGVVLLELVTGRRAIEETDGEGRDIVSWVSSHVDRYQHVYKVLDHKLALDYHQNEMTKVFMIATLCTAKRPSLRPDMRDVVRMLTDTKPLSFKLKEKCRESKDLYLA
ncbi:receptor protein-tyrosine kinase CEPR2 [Heracleum sosnowskyi]|uniref:Receptor protein-tyrosine kinase CEPR2 n=1 Tax=Heracleum sosnowskyi TaxID=360622 RepID=A0AAD8IG12_9APIA|nr:receptor protein-tyrosine kinase CEPR2 [Heracleum sosnowskyi]